MPEQVEQHVSPRRIASQLKRLNAPQNVFAEYADIGASQVCLFLAGERRLSIDAQLAVLKAMQFFEWVAGQVGGPVDFSNTTALAKYWKQFVRLHTENEVIRTNDELRAQAQGDAA
jgi:hypothetical protein